MILFQPKGICERRIKNKKTYSFKAYHRSSFSKASSAHVKSIFSNQPLSGTAHPALTGTFSASLFIFMFPI